MLLNLILRQPELAKVLGLSDFHPIRDFLDGEQPLESPAEALIAMVEQLNPELVIIDAPPVPMSDDVLALPQLDAILFVMGGTQTTADDMRACKRLFDGK